MHWWENKFYLFKSNKPDLFQDYCLENIQTYFFIIGEGGYSKVYDVFDDSNELLALKVVNLNDPIVKGDLMAEIHFLRELKHCERVINMIDYEVKDHVEGLPFDIENKTKDPNGDQGKKIFVWHDWYIVHDTISIWIKLN